MGAIVEPVYLVPALTAVLVLGLLAEKYPGLLPATAARPWRGRRAPKLDAAGLRPTAVTRRVA
jgi:hypothetical protein